MNCHNNYKVLNTNIFRKGIFSLVPIRYEDRYSIMKWRNEQLYHLRQKKPLTESDQEYYFKEIVSKIFEDEKPNQLLFSYMKEKDCIGYGGLVHINWEDKNAELSFIINTQLEFEEFEFHWVNYLNLIEKVAFEELNLHKIYTYAFNLRQHLYKLLEDHNYIKEAELKDHVKIDDKFVNVIIHSKINKSGSSN